LEGNYLDTLFNAYALLQMVVCSFSSNHDNNVFEDWIIRKFKRSGTPNIPEFPHTLSLYEARQFSYYEKDDTYNHLDDITERLADKPLQVCVTFVRGAPSLVCFAWSTMGTYLTSATGRL
jgi:hypothetical protein